MKPYTYFILFPQIDKLYYGKAVDERRYRGNTLGGEFFGPHHNEDVQNLLDAGYKAIWVRHLEFETERQALDYEDRYLKTHWVSSEWSSRPNWMLNRNRNAVGGIHPLASEGIRRAIKENRHNFTTIEGRERNRKKASERNGILNRVRCSCLKCHKEVSYTNLNKHITYCEERDKILSLHYEFLYKTWEENGRCGFRRLWELTSIGNLSLIQSIVQEFRNTTKDKKPKSWWSNLLTGKSLMQENCPGPEWERGRKLYNRR